MSITPSPSETERAGHTKGPRNPYAGQPYEAFDDAIYGLPASGLSFEGLLAASVIHGLPKAVFDAKLPTVVDDMIARDRRGNARAWLQEVFFSFDGPDDQASVVAFENRDQLLRKALENNCLTSATAFLRDAIGDDAARAIIIDAMKEPLDKSAAYAIRAAIKKAAQTP